MALRLTFYGGAGKVTGANFLVEGGGAKILVDCGIEQGADFCETCTYDEFPYDPRALHALVVTHAHLDHVGRIPRLVHAGFRGSIYMTPPTRDLAELILRDSLEVLTHEKLGPLYGAHDVDETFRLTKTIEYHKEWEVVPGLTATLFQTSHILGSASVHIAGDGGALAVTGDIGQNPSPLLPDWEPVKEIDALVMESVYGDKAHPEDRVRGLRATLAAAIERGGAILIPAFSLERTQLMLYELSNFFSAGELPKVPVYLDSPLAIAITDLYEKWGSEYFKPEAQDEIRREKSIFNFPFLTKAKSRDQSDHIEAAPNPKIIIAGAGMSHGGRIGRWETKYLPDPTSTLLIVGYQAAGSPGRLLEEGVKNIRIQGRDVPVRAKVEKLGGWSAHADRDELLRFAEASAADKRLKTIFTALGEPGPARFLAQRIHDYLGVRAIAPEIGQRWEIAKTGITRLA